MSLNSIYKDVNEFISANNIGMYYNETLTYAAFIESRITNNLMLINNPNLCEHLGINYQDLLAELRVLLPIRKKLSLNIKNKNHGR